MKLRHALFLLPGLLFAENTPVYIGSRNEGISRVMLDEKTGEISNKTLAHKGRGMVFQAMSSDRKFLFSAQKVEGKGGVASFKVTEEGLMPISMQSYDGRGLCHISLDQTGKVLLGTEYGGGKVVSFLVGEDGKLSETVSLHQHEGSSVHPKRQKKAHAHSIYAGPDNRFAYAPDLGMDVVKFYQMNPATAELTDKGGFKLPPGSGPRHMKFGKDGKFAYILNELTTSISVFERNANSGELTIVETVRVLPEEEKGDEMTCSEILVSKDGKFIYTGNRDIAEQSRDSVSVLQVAQDGRLKLIQTEPAKVWIPRNINITPSGDWLLIAGQKANEVRSFRVDQTTGTLTSSDYQVQAELPMCIQFGN